MSELKADGRCPFCRTEVDYATAADGGQDAIKAGDVTVCIYCANGCIVTAELGLRRPTEWEAARLEKDRVFQLIKARAMLAIVRTRDRAKMERALMAAAVADCEDGDSKPPRKGAAYPTRRGRSKGN